MVGQRGAQFPDVMSLSLSISVSLFTAGARPNGAIVQWFNGSAVRGKA